MPTLAIDADVHQLTGECILGRHRSCAIQVKDNAASRQHCKVYLSDGLWWVEDLGSANGTQLNGAKIAGRKRLRDKDRIAIGETIIRFAEELPGELTAPERPAVAAPAEPAPAATTTDADALAGLAGQEISGYRLDRYLGRGMLGAVYRGQQLNLDRPVAFKVFDPARCTRDASLPKRFLAEAGKVGSVVHDGLVHLHESGVHENLLWCSMEWVEGDTVEKLLKRDGRIDPGMALLITERIAEALGVAHASGVIHGDLRPSHVIVMADGRVKLTDVGMMGIFEEGELPSDGPASLAWYLSPEEAAEGASDPRSDIYSLGCMLFHLLTGKPPFSGADTGAVIAAHSAERIPSITAHGAPKGLDPAGVDALLSGLMAKNPAWRHATMAEVIADVRPLREKIGQRSELAPALRRASGTAAAPTSATASASASSSAPGSTVSPAPRARTTPEQTMRKVFTAVLVVIVAAVLVALVLPYVTRRAPAEPETPVAVQPQPATPPVRPAQPTQPTQPGTVRPPVATVPAAGATALLERWRQTQAAVDRAQAANEWSTAEQELATFAAATGSAAADAQIAAQLADRQQQVAQDGDQWYRTALAALPRSDAPGDLARRLQGVDGLRDVVLSDNRPDAESRYQEALTKLGQRLNDSRRQARQAVETGRPADLPRIASELAPAFAGTPVAELHRQFTLLCNEGAGIRPLWATSWAVTRPRLLAAKGADALAAAAALMLVGDTTEAKALLANDAALASGDLLRRREALAGRKAAVLTFDDPDDLQYMEVIAGSPRMSAGALTGTAGEAISLACAAPLAASGWDVAVGLGLEQTQADGAAVISLLKGDDSGAQVRIERDAVFVRLRTAGGWQEVRAARPAGKVLRVRIGERAGQVSALVNDQLLLRAPGVRVPAGSVVHIEAVGVAWSLTDLQVVGGD